MSGPSSALLPGGYLSAEGRLARNVRLLELARHNGYPIEIGEDPRKLAIRFWRVPDQLLAIAGDEFLALPA